MIFSPLYNVDQLALQQQVPLGQQMIADQVLIGSHSDAIAHTQRTQHVENLKQIRQQSIFGTIDHSVSHPGYKKTSPEDLLFMIYDLFFTRPVPRGLSMCKRCIITQMLNRRKHPVI